VDDQREVTRVLGEQAPDALGVADVELDPAELVRVGLDQAFAGPPRGSVGPEELSAHVVFDPDHVEAGFDEVPHRLRSDQPS
jgi:hypothetical protein